MNACATEGCMYREGTQEMVKVKRTAMVKVSYMASSMHVCTCAYMHVMPGLTCSNLAKTRGFGLEGEGWRVRAGG